MKQQIILMAVYNKIQCDARVIRAATALNKAGFVVRVISCNSDPNFTDQNFESIIYSSAKRGFPLFWRFCYFVFTFALREHKKVDLLYMHDYQLVFVGRIIAFFTGRKWIYDAHELLLQRKKHCCSKREKFFQFLERISISSADLVIAANTERERIIRRIFRLKNTVSVANIAPIFVPDFKVLDKKDILLYQGVLSEERDLTGYISALKKMPPHVMLKVIGGGPRLEYYRNLVENDELLKGRIIFTGQIPYVQLVQESQECKIGIISYLLDDLNNYYCSPNKLFEYIQMGIPVLVSPQPFLKKVVRKYRIGAVLPPSFSEQELVKSVLDILEHYNSFRAGMNTFLADYSHEREMAKLRNAVKELVVPNEKDCQ
ncbi:glycosyltransferase family 4 protein [Victivallis vadensis]|uniref:Glycosyltransferase family 4 protein n=1 Tax=Victivallis vadensis TaxID=172901 RepID=A0A848AY65_9BACT|nr:glycosyltransferase [Victivallis vadensis]NMD88178.1 glycosyltransferase family 4 protein [Victivallis vadensis]